LKASGSVNHFAFTGELDYGESSWIV